MVNVSFLVHFRAEESNNFSGTMARYFQLLQQQDEKIGLLRSSLQEARDCLESTTSNTGVGLVAGSSIQQATEETKCVVAVTIVGPSPQQKEQEVEKLKSDIHHLEGKITDLSSQLKRKSDECNSLKAGKRLLTSQMTRLEKQKVSLEDAIRNQLKEVEMDTATKAATPPR